MFELELRPEDEELLKNWYAVLKGVSRGDIDDPSKKVSYDYHEFMGDHAKLPERPHNRRMLAFIAGPIDGKEPADARGAISDRQRLLIRHAFQMYDHSTNKEREDRTEKRQSHSLILAFLLGAVPFAFLTADLMVSKNILWTLPLGATVFYIGMAVWLKARRYDAGRTASAS